MVFESMRFSLLTFGLFFGLVRALDYNVHLTCPPKTYMELCERNTSDIAGAHHNATHTCKSCTECHGRQLRPCTLKHDAVCNFTAAITEVASTETFVCKENEFIDRDNTCRKCAVCEFTTMRNCTLHSDTLCMLTVQAATPEPAYLLFVSDTDGENAPGNSVYPIRINELYVITLLTFVTIFHNPSSYIFLWATRAKSPTRAELHTGWIMQLYFLGKLRC